MNDSTVFMIAGITMVIITILLYKAPIKYFAMWTSNQKIKIFVRKILLGVFAVLSIIAFWAAIKVA